MHLLFLEISVLLAEVLRVGPCHEVRIKHKFFNSSLDIDISFLGLHRNEHRVDRATENR